MQRESKQDAYHTDVRLGMLFADRAEYTIPVGPTEVRRSTEGGNSVFLSTNVLYLWNQRSTTQGGLYDKWVLQ